MKVLVISPHMDDEALGAGGAILKHKAQGDHVSVVFVAHRVYGHSFDPEKNKVEESHALAAKEVLGYDEAVFLRLQDERLDAAVQDVIIPLEEQVSRIRPEVVYVPFSGDNNQDHRAVYQAARVVLRPLATPFITSVRMYEVPSSTEQSPPLLESAFLPNLYADIDKHVEQKLRAVACYETEARPYPHPRSEEALRALAMKRGVDAGLKHAEAFMNIRQRWA